MSVAGIKLRDALAALRWKNLSPEDVAATIAEILIEQLQPLRDRVAALESAEAEKCFKGVYESGVRYRKHNVVGHAGSMWVATDEPTGSPPGNGWTLAVKRGKDAR